MTHSLPNVITYEYLILWILYGSYLFFHNCSHIKVVDQSKTNASDAKNVFKHVEILLDFPFSSGRNRLQLTHIML